MVAKTLELPFFYFGAKPLKKGFNKAIQEIQRENKQITNKNIAAVGDQIFTDIIGANRLHLYPILVKPIAEKDIWITRLKRPLEKYLIRKWRAKQKKGK